ncbi:MAG: alpha/beta fold hydrolase [Verrucomicrobiales bacterium]|nr:alpha/beta fold hydrolase [Verrucomicrobiales bacterium]
MNTRNNDRSTHQLRPTIGLLIGLTLSLFGPLINAQTPVVMQSVDRSTNRVRVTWTDPTPNQAYTVQIRDSVSSGAWRTAPTRYRWPWPHTHWGDATRNLPATRYYRVNAQTVTPANRGKLLSNLVKAENSLATLDNAFELWGFKGFALPKFATVARKFTYETIDPFGLPITASALLILPQGTNGPLPLASVQHGTIAMKSDAPSQPGSGDNLAVLLATQGYAVVVPDYLGLGDSPSYQSYLYSRSEATCVIDALRAGKSLCASNKVTLNGKLFLAGFSQGGHVTMATHRELEASHADEFAVTASAPCAGTYDLGGVTTEALLSKPDYPISYPFAMILAAYLPIYQLADTLEELLAEPYRRLLPPLLDGNHNETEITAVLPSDPVAILRSDYQSDFRTNPNNPLRQAMLENNNYDWTPKAPVRLIHSRGDTIAPFANAQIAYDSFINRGACCVSLVDPGAPAKLSHEDSYVPSVREVFTWFATFP